MLYILLHQGGGRGSFVSENKMLSQGGTRRGGESQTAQHMILTFQLQCPTGISSCPIHHSAANKARTSHARW